MERLDATGYLAAPGWTEAVVDRLSDVIAVHDRLVLAGGPPQPRARFVRNVWLDVHRASVESIGDAARQLRAIQRNWALYSTAHHRRAALIEEKLPRLAGKPLEFPAAAPAAPLGSWTLVDRDTMLVAPTCTHFAPNGEVRFVEDKVGPPSRAYLKLYEALTLLGDRPLADARCLDAGCSPGGWTWVLAKLGADVLAVDRSPLDAGVAAMPGVRFESASAFSIQPNTHGPFDWIFSDVICYPPRLLEWVRRWVDSGRCENFVCTIKFQDDDTPSDDPYAIAEEFAAIPGSRVVHLVHNKHELTWMRKAT